MNTPAVMMLPQVSNYSVLSWKKLAVEALGCTWLDLYWPVLIKLDQFYSIVLLDELDDITIRYLIDAKLGN